MRKEGLEPSRCYPQVPETCASTSSATFAGLGKDSDDRRIGQLRATGAASFGRSFARETTAPPAARLRSLGFMVWFLPSHRTLLSLTRRLSSLGITRDAGRP